MPTAPDTARAKKAAAGALRVYWPAPPFFKSIEAQFPGQQPECTLEMIDGRVLRKDLLELEPGATSVALRSTTEPSGVRRIPVGNVRYIKLTRAVTYVPDLEALKAVGAPESALHPQKPFEIILVDGHKLTGKTLGFVKDPSGIYLFLVEGDSLRAVHCFVPNVQIKDVQIGPQLGAVLLENKVVSPDSLSQALNAQAKLRQERIGKYLTDRAIISGEELLNALQSQESRPAVRLGDILVESELISAEHLQEALAIQADHRGRKVGEILIEIGAVTPRVIQFALSDKLGIPYVNVREFDIGPGALEAVDMALAIKHQVLPLLRTADTLVVAVEDPFGIDIAQELRFHAGIGISPVIANPQDIKARIAKEYANLESRAISGGVATEAAGRIALNQQTRVSDLTSQLVKESQQSTRPEKDITVDARVSENTLVRLVNKIIIEAHGQGASDIHIEANGGKFETKIRFRKDGDLEDYLSLPPAYSSAIVSRLKVMADLDISERRRPQDGKIDFSKHGPLEIELRLAIVPTANGLEDVVLRILANAEALPLAAVGFSDLDLRNLRSMIARSYGLILVCGPTGSGKTTTLHSVLHEINKPDIKIWTAEDPVEITQPGLRQVQVQPKLDWTFAAAMRAFLRADPDVIMVGEMRDAETTRIGIEASLTGHLVFSTLHTNSAAESVIRLLDMGMDPFNFADALIGILSQRLSRKLCVNCKQTRAPGDEELLDLAKEYCTGTGMNPAEVLQGWRTQYGVDGRIILREPGGCDACREGFKGRVVVYELLSGTPEVKRLVRTHSPVPELLAAAQNSGMLTLRQCAIDKVLRGVLDIGSARAVAS
jgi:type II secretory ATPase GspE/PulE/Tfp pilus assembly ATPase PilB-like protein